MSLFRRPPMMDRGEILALAGVQPLFDPVFSHLLEEALAGRVEVFRAVVPTVTIRPFDVDYDPTRHPAGQAAVEEVDFNWRQGRYSPVWLYQRGEVFVLSDDYTIWAAIQRGNPDSIPCLVLGRPVHPEATEIEGPLDRSALRTALGFDEGATAGMASDVSSTDEHQDFLDLQGEWHAGRVAIGVDRAFARRFYTDQDLAFIQGRTGERPTADWAIVRGFWFVGPIALIVASILAIVALRGWALLAIPIGVIGFHKYQGRSSIGNAPLFGISWMFVVAALIFVTDEPSNRAATGTVAAYFLALWSLRFMYVMAAARLRAFVLRNHRAFAWLRGEITIRTIHGREPSDAT